MRDFSSAEAVVWRMKGLNGLNDAAISFGQIIEADALHAA